MLKRVSKNLAKEFIHFWGVIGSTEGLPNFPPKVPIYGPGELPDRGAKRREEVLRQILEARRQTKRDSD